MTESVRGSCASDHDLRSATDAISKKYFGGAILAQGGAELRARGSKIDLRDFG